MRSMRLFHIPAILYMILRDGGSGVRCSMLKGTALMSARDASTVSSCVMKIERKMRENAMKKKYASQFPRTQRWVRWFAFVSVSRPLLMEPNATMPMTPMITIIVPWIHQSASPSVIYLERTRTYMSLLVTGEFTRNLANKKLKISEVDPRGATYSAHR